MADSNKGGSSDLYGIPVNFDSKDVEQVVPTNTTKTNHAEQNEDPQLENEIKLGPMDGTNILSGHVEVEKYNANSNFLSEDTASMPGIDADFAATTVESSLSTAAGGGGKPSSIAQLVRTWENYMTTDGSVMDQFEPLQMFQQFDLCGAGEGLVRLGPPITHGSSSGEGDLLDPYHLRHTHSSPLHKTPSMLDDSTMEPPVPIGWGETLNRSRSTPLTTSANSAFGTILRTMPYIGGGHDRSAFTLPKTRSSDASVARLNPRYSAFDPISFRSEMDVLSESTSIEVMKMSPPRNNQKVSPADPLSVEKVQQDQPSPSKGPGTAATSRAARFLSDVRALRRRRKERCGRENPAMSASSLDDSTKTNNLHEAGHQEEDRNTLDDDDDDVMLSSDRIIVNVASQESSQGHESKGEESIDDSPTPVANSYQQLLDSDADDECEHFQNKRLSIDSDSPATIPSPMYQPMTDDRPGSLEEGRRGVRIQFSDVIAKHPIEEGVERGISPEYSSPIPSGQMARDISNLTPHSHDSPGTLRSSSTSNTSGHTTQATSTTASSGQMSHLSSISETDREVMEANKVGSLLARQERDAPVIVNNSTEMPTGPTSALDYALGYFALGDSTSPVPLREGANVQADRFFTFSESQAGSSITGRLRTSSSSKKGTSHSPITVSSSSMNTNSCSSSSGGDEPPTFVSYLDRQAASDLTSLREAAEASSSREGGGDIEERESPSEILGYSNLVFEEAKAPREATTTSKQPRPIWPASKGALFRRRVRSLPPRSPVKGARATPTPPPYRESTSPACLSPPRTIVDHRIEPNVSRPYVLRTTPGCSPSVVSSGHKVAVVTPEAQSTFNYTPVFGDGAEEGAQEVVRECSGNLYTTTTMNRGTSPIFGGFRSRTYVEHSIEILKTDSKEESSTPSPILVPHEKRTDEA